ncbi:hypothetical protein DRQ20_06370 [bacterium]|nr:MAG: hypothetical protein DRQ20_06370 [bacterium]
MRKVITLFFFAFLLSGAGEKPEGYRIEVVKDTLREGSYVRVEDKEIRFISPEGKVVKTVKLGVESWKEGKVWYLRRVEVDDTLSMKGLILIGVALSKSDYSPDVPGAMETYECWDYEVEVMDFSGEVRFRKSFRTYCSEDPTCAYWLGRFSKEGNAVMFYYRDSLDNVHIEVYDMDRHRLAEAQYDQEMWDIQISPDGKIVGAETLKKIGDRYYRHLFFVDVETGRTKLVKAEGEINRKRWTGYFILSSTPKPPPSGKIRIGVDPHLPIPGGGVKTKDVSFDELPSDLSVLFEEGGEK